MKKLFVLIALLGLLGSCKPDAPTEYSYVVPANASELAAIELQALVEKAGLNSEKGQNTLQQIIALLLEGKPEALAEATRLQKEPEATGIDWKRPALLFQAPGLHATAMSLCINDLKQWESLVESMVKAQVFTSPEKGDQCRRTMMAGTGLGLYYNKGTLLMLFTENPTRLAQMHSKADELLRQEAGQSIHANTYYDRMMKQTGDIRLMATPESLPFDLQAIVKYPAGTPLLGYILFQEGGIDAEVRRAGFEGNSQENTYPFRPTNSMELQGALLAIMHGKPFHIELGRNELLTISNIGVMMEYDPDEPQLATLYSLINQVESLTLRGDSNCTRFTLLLNDKSQNALQQLVDFAQQLLF